MRKYFLFLAALLLSSCIPVEDLGVYRDKGTVDPAFMGTWQMDRKTDPDARPIVITRKGDMYRIDSSDEKEREKKDYKPAFARTLQAPGGNVFLMVFTDEKGGREGDLIRYKITGGNLIKIYSLNAPAMRKLLREKYPQVKNINADRETVSIRTLDDDAFKILSGIPDNENYWKLENNYTKLK